MNASDIERVLTDLLEERKQKLEAIDQGLVALFPIVARRGPVRARMASLVNDATGLCLVATTERLLRDLLVLWNEPLPKTANLSISSQRAVAIVLRRAANGGVRGEIGRLQKNLDAIILWRNDYAHGAPQRDPLDPGSIKRDLTRFLKALL